MQLDMIGLRQMGARTVRRLLMKGHECVIYARPPPAVGSPQKDAATAATLLIEVVSRTGRPRAIWLMVSAASVDLVLGDLAPPLEAGDIVIEAGNSNYRGDIRRGTKLQARGIHYLDVGTSGGVVGLERGYCLMISGGADIFQHLRPSIGSCRPCGANSALMSRRPARN